MEVVLAVSEIRVYSEVLVAVFNADRIHSRGFVLAEYLYKQSEVSPESIGVAFLVASNMGEFVDEGEYKDVVVVVLTGAVPQAHIYILLVVGIRRLAGRWIHVLE